VIYPDFVRPLPLEDLDHILLHTERFWSAARGTRIFISGGTGFFGAWLVESMAHCNRRLDLGLSATVLTRDPEAYLDRMPHLASEPSIRFHRGDIRDFTFPEEPFDFVVHAAAPTTGVKLAGQSDLLDTLLDGTKRMIELAKRRDAKRFLFVSSGAVYGPQPKDMDHLAEDYRGSPAWLDPVSAYAEGKRASELMCALASGQTSIHFRIARCFAFVGPHLPLDRHFAIGNFIRDAMAGADISIRGDGTPLRSYLYGADLAIWLWTMILAEPPVADALPVVNIGSEEAVSILDLAKEVAAVVNPNVRIEVAQQLNRSVLPVRYVPDTQRAKALFNLRPLISRREAIRRTAEWHRSSN